MHRLIPIPVILAVVGCAGDPKFVDASSGPPTIPLWMKATQQSAEKSCCQNISELPFQDLPRNISQVAEITTATPYFDFPEGPSRFLAYRLSSAGLSRLRVKTFVIKYSWGSPSMVFYPYLTFLNRDYERVASIDPPLQREASFLEGSAWVTDVDVPAQAAYVVIHVPKAKFSTYLKTGASPSGTLLPIGNKLLLAMPPTDVDGVAVSGSGRLEFVYQNISESPKP